VQDDVYSDVDDHESNSAEVEVDEVNEALQNTVQADEGNEEMVPSVDNEYIRSLLMVVVKLSDSEASLGRDHLTSTPR
jgi:hypothetical protein